MPLLQVRELLQFQPNPDNATETVINGVHFNLTALEHFNYTLYSNNTLSNVSNCLLVFDNYKPHMLSNGTFINGTSCYAPIDPVETRGHVGIAFATMFALTILFSLVNLRKHGRRFLPIHKKWNIVGRRWQWYWLLFLGACGTISCFTSIDVDRDYLPGLAIILQSVFYHMMLPVMLAAIWEGARHWGSWLERQIYDRDAFAFEAASTRERQELYMPLVFYLFGFLNFFLTIPRSWTPIQKQRSDQQQANVAMPAATDGRFKSASVIAICCILVICYGLGHSVYRYKECPAGRSRVLFYATSVPAKFILVILLASAKVAFNIAAAFEFGISPLNIDSSPGYIYGLGYTPALLILLIFNIWGYFDPNEDRALIKQRVARGHAQDVELGIEAGRRKPDWWKMVKGEFTHVSGNDPTTRLRAMVDNVAGSGRGKPQQQDPVAAQELELSNIQRNRKQGEQEREPHKQQRSTENKPAAGTTTTGEQRRASGGNLLSPELQPSRVASQTASQVTTSSGETLTPQAPPQKIRSMLDV